MKVVQHYKGMPCGQQVFFGKAHEVCTEDMPQLVRSKFELQRALCISTPRCSFNNTDLYDTVHCMNLAILFSGEILL